MDKPFPAYRGDEPYIFVSYSHDDEAEVGTEIRWLQNRGVNVWFDEGIVPGHEWTESLGAAISGCSTFLYFITPRSVSSEYCRRELGLAIEKSLKIMAVYLEPTDLPVGLQLSLGNRQGIFKLALSESDYQKQLYDALPIDVIADDAKPFDGARHETTGKHHIQNDQRRGILVLPFTNRSRDEDTKYICGGIADEITTALSAVEPLRVIARGSAMQIASENRNLKSIGQQLNVAYVLQGSVQKIGEKLRITAQLPSTQSTEILWTDKWTSNVDQIFEIQEVIARGVVDALEIQLNASQNARLSERPIPNIHAYEYYLRARSLIYQYTADALDQALTYLDLGAEIIGANAHFISAIGYVHWQFHNAGIDLDPRHKEEAYKCAHELFALNPHSSAGHRLIGLLMFREKGAMSESIQHLNTSLQADPNDTDALL